MVRMGSVHFLDFSVFHSPSVDVLEAFKAYLNGMYFDKSCSDRAVAL